MKALVFLLFPLILNANWQVGTGTGAYLGAAQLQTQWESEARAHHINLSYGHTRDQIVKAIQQYSFVYQWSPFAVETDEKIWKPLLVGPFITYTDNPNYFFKSPSRYNNDVYYDVTNVRWGVRFSTQLIMLKLADRPIAFSVDGSLLEKGILAFFNSPRELDVFKYYWSLGLSLRVEL